MKTLLLQDFKHDYSEVIKQCISTLNSDEGVVLLPTETVYGLVCDWKNDNSKKKIYKIKRRDGEKPLQMLVPNRSCLDDFGVTVFPALEKLTDKFCPGPITFIVDVDNGKKIGFRIPDYKLVLDLLNEFKSPLAATSANLSGSPPALSVDKALLEFTTSPDLIIDGGPLPINSLASTVAYLKNDGDFNIIRPGKITERMIRATLKNA